MGDDHVKRFGRWGLLRDDFPDACPVLLDYGRLLSTGRPSMYRVDYIGAYVAVALFGWLP